MNNKEPLRPLFIKPTMDKHIYRARSKPMDGPMYPVRQPIEHGNYLKGLFNDIINISNIEMREGLKTADGFYVDFIGAQDSGLNLKSLENLSSEIRLSNIKEQNGRLSATLFIPEDKKNYYINKIEKYLNLEEGETKRKNDPLIRSIDNIQRSVIQSFWNGSEESIPTDEKVWCEIWLVNHKNTYRDNILAELSSISEEHNIEIKTDNILEFQERLVLIAKLNRNDILKLINFSTHLSEIKPNPTPVIEFIEMYPSEQTEWCDDLIDRTKITTNNNVSVCILDTGVEDNHPLLNSLLTYAGAYNHSWGSKDWNGHGTEMTGLSAYGNLSSALLSGNDIIINYELSSMKILPPAGNDENLWGTITEQAVLLKALEEPNKKNIFCMAVTATSDIPNNGKPTSWSASIDNLMFDQDDVEKLFIVAAGNVNIFDSRYQYPSSNYATEIQEPSQSWNALTIGAYTTKTNISMNTMTSYSNAFIVANSNEISPHTSSTITWDNGWPIKPDVVFEGGNCFSATNINCDIDGDLSLLTTNYQYGLNNFTYTFATSAATAIATKFTADLYSKFPNLNPETIRGLVIHSADWTDEMIARHSSSASTIDKKSLLRSCGYGIPNLDKAINCYRNSLTLICEDELQPYRLDEGKIKTNEMNFYELPWPVEALLALENQNITMRITLSYFIEPSPGRVDNLNLDRYRYQSHGLRFELIHPDESEEHFLARVNDGYNGTEEYIPGEYSTSGHWTIGSNLRRRGNIISDTWTGTASELTTSNKICIFPIIGWWKSKEHLKHEKHYDKKARYSLIVSIHSEDNDIDIYSPVKALIEQEIEQEVEVTI